MISLVSEGKDAIAAKAEKRSTSAFAMFPRRLLEIISPSSRSSEIGKLEAIRFWISSDQKGHRRVALTTRSSSYAAFNLVAALDLVFPPDSSSDRLGRKADPNVFFVRHFFVATSGFASPPTSFVIAGLCRALRLYQGILPFSAGKKAFVPNFRSGTPPGRAETRLVKRRQFGP